MGFAIDPDFLIGAVFSAFLDLMNLLAYLTTKNTAITKTTTPNNHSHNQSDIIIIFWSISIILWFVFISLISTIRFWDRISICCRLSVRICLGSIIISRLSCIICSSGICIRRSGCSISRCRRIRWLCSRFRILCNTICTSL